MLQGIKTAITNNWGLIKKKHLRFEWLGVHLKIKIQITVLEYFNNIFWADNN